MASHTAVSPAPLRAVGWLVMLVGVALSIVSVFVPTLLDTILSVAATQSLAEPAGSSAQLGMGISGALMSGWGLMLLLLGRGRAPTTATLAGAALWYMVDSSASLLLGFGWNAVSNSLIMAAFLLLLPSVRRERA